jgi:hypothetical protein
MKKLRYILGDKAWLPISRAAGLLRTNATGIRKLMGEGVLDWRQTRANSRTFVVAEVDVMRLRANLPDAKLIKKKEPLPKVPLFEPYRRTRGGLWQDHHLRMTLPHPEDERDDKKD